jgi:hypothetical protein
MNELVAHPAVQGAVIPFVASAAAAFALRGRALALAVALGLAVTAVLLLGWELQPLTTTRKLVLVSLLAAVAAAGVARLAPGQARAAHAVLAIAMAVGAVWVVQRALAQQPPAEAAAMMAAAAVFMIVLLAGLSPAQESVLANAAVAVMLPWAAAAVAIQGASAVLALLAMAAGTAAFAGVLYGFVVRRRRFTREFAYPSTVAAALVVLASVVMGGVTAWALVPVAAAPWCARFLNRFHTT